MFQEWKKDIAWMQLLGSMLCTYVYNQSINVQILHFIIKCSCVHKLWVLMGSLLNKLTELEYPNVPLQLREREGGGRGVYATTT